MKLKALAGAITLALGTSSAFAAAIVGDIAFSQLSTTTITPTGGSGTMATATGFSFGNPVPGGYNMQAVASTGTFVAEGVVAGFPGGTLGTQYAFTFSPNTPVNPLWTIDGFSFSATSFTLVSQTNSLVTIRGAGVISHAGYDDSVGQWDFTANNSGSVFSWSSSATVPLPATVGLIGLGLAAVGAVSRRRVAA